MYGRRCEAGKVHPITGHEAPNGKYIYTSTLSLTSVLDRVGGQSHASVVLPREREPVPIVGDARIILKLVIE
jgi:hypothetical protein